MPEVYKVNALLRIENERLRVENARLRALVRNVSVKCFECGNWTPCDPPATSSITGEPCCLHCTAPLSAIDCQQPQ